MTSDITNQDNSLKSAADEARELMDSINKKDRIKDFTTGPGPGPNESSSNEPGKNPIRVSPPIPLVHKTPMENLIDESRQKNNLLLQERERGIKYNVKPGTYDRIEKILRDGGMDSMSVSKSLDRIKEVLNDQEQKSELGKAESDELIPHKTEGIHGPDERSLNNPDNWNQNPGNRPAGDKESIEEKNKQDDLNKKNDGIFRGPK